MSDSKLPSEIDRIVGQRLRWRRRELKYTQEKLGELLELTFQQVQKYEKGVNRISAGRLYEISSVLDVPISYFYDGADEYIAPARGAMRNESDPAAMPVITSELQDLIAAFQKISDPGLRKSILATVKAASQALKDDDAKG